MMKFLGKGMSGPVGIDGKPQSSYQWSMDYFECTECGGIIWSSPAVQKCLRKEKKCPYCEGCFKKLSFYKKCIKRIKEVMKYIFIRMCSFY